MQKSERLFNVLLGLSVFVWAVVNFFDSSHPRPIIVQLSVTCLQIVVGFLFLIRSPIRTHGSIQTMSLAAPAVLIGGVAIGATAADWTWYAQACLLAGALFTVTSLLFLGKSFSVLPALRQIVSAGPYRIVRHPVYAGELLMVFGCVLVCPIVYGVPIFVLTVAFLAVRIFVEERLLRNDAEYGQYCERVQWRMIPWIW